MRLNIRKRIKDDVLNKFGPMADPQRVIDYLYENGTLDDVLARKHMIRVELFRRLLTENIRMIQIEEDLAEDFGCTRQFVNHLANKSCA